MRGLESSESKRRLYDKLSRDLGESILHFLNDPDVCEVMINPDGQVWVDSLTQGLKRVGERSQAHVLAIIHSVAGIQGMVVNAQNPRLEADLPVFNGMRGERLTAQVPPIVAAPCLTLRKKSERVFTLADYCQSGRLTDQQADALSTLVQQRKNILVCGGPGSGKTTVTNALIGEAVKHDPDQRWLILEDLPELQCQAANVVAMVTTDTVNLTGLVRAAMRMRPDRILIGEVRGAEALDLLKAWNTGCPGGICTVHANGAVEAIQRLLDLAMEAGLSKPPLSLVSHTIDAVVSVKRVGHQKGWIDEILTFTLENNTHEPFSFQTLV